MEAESEVAIRDLLVREHRWLQRLARGLLRDPADADDLAQDLRVLALRRRPHVGDGLRGWFAAAGQRLAMARRRQRDERVRRERRAARAEAGDPDADARLALHRRLLDAVMDLAEPYRSTVVACYLEGRRPRDVAAEKGIAPDVVRQRLARALQQLRARLDIELGGRSRLEAALLPVAALGGPAAALFGIGSAWMTTKQILAAVVLAVGLAGVGFHLLASAPAPASEDDVPAAAAGNRAAVAPQGAREERVRVAETTERRAACFLVTDVHGRPITRGRVFAWQDGTSHRQADLDADGRVRLLGLSGAGGYLVDCDGHHPVQGACVRLDGEHEVVVGGARTLRGVVEIDGAPPRPGELSLRLRDADRDDAPLPESLRELFGYPSSGRPEQVVAVGADGGFVFRGLPAGWRGAVRWPRHYLVRDVEPGTCRGAQSGGVGLDAIPAVLRISLVRLPVLEGRMLWADTRTPVVSAHGSAWLSVSMGCSPPGSGFRIEAGRFLLFPAPQDDEVRLYMAETARPRIRGARLSVHVPALGISHEFELEAEDIARGPDVELLLPRPRMRVVEVCVSGPAGPLAGAVLRGKTKSRPTDAEGRTTFRVRAEGESGVVLCAPGHEIRVLELHAADISGEGPLHLALERARGVRLRVRSASGEVPAGLGLALVVQPGSLLADHQHPYRAAFEGINGLRRDRNLIQRTRDGQVVIHYALPGPRVEVLSPSTDTPLGIEIRDRLCQVLCRAEVPRLRDEGVQELELVVPETRELVVTVRDPSGAPVPRVGVALRRDGHGVHRYTDAAGLIRVVPVRAGRAEFALEVAAPPGFVVHDPTTVYTWNPVLVLQPSRPFRLRVVDTAGAPLEGVPLHIGDGPRHLTGRDGEVSIPRQAAGRLTVVVRIGGHDVPRPVDNDGSALRLVLPRVGQLSIRGAAPTGFDGSHASVDIEPIDEELRRGFVEGYHVSLERAGAELESRPVPMLPGRYRASFRRDGARLPLGRVTVVAGETTVLRLPW